MSAGTDLAKEVEQWEPAASSPKDVLLSTRWVNAGAYQKGDRWLALNRPPTEDVALVLDEGQVDRLFNGLDCRTVEQNIGDSGSLASEIWRAFLILMGVALFTEACLCLPDKKVVAFEPASRDGFARMKAANA